MSVKIAITLFGVLCLGAVAVHGLECYDINLRNITCNEQNTKTTVGAMAASGYNVSSLNSYPSYGCLRLNQTSEFTKI